jgi:maleylpyruvate isomerase
MKLYGYWRSSATWRVRTTLALKNVPFDYVPVHLVREGGHQNAEWYRELNPMSQVPTLEVEIRGKTRKLAQSLAIMEFLEETYPSPALLPEDPFLRARTRQLSEIINSGIQPLQNLAVLQHLKFLGQDSNSWALRWIEKGLVAFEELSMDIGGLYSVGETPTFADICLIPQLYNARRFDVDVSKFPRLLQIEERCAELDAFVASHPDAWESADAAHNGH